MIRNGADYTLPLIALASFFLLFALVLCGYAAICAAGIGTAHLVHKLQKR